MPLIRKKRVRPLEIHCRVTFCSSATWISVLPRVLVRPMARLISSRSLGGLPLRHMNESIARMDGN